MKYKNICDRDFKTKGDAYKYFRGLVRQTVPPFEQPNVILLTERTPLKSSYLNQITKEYGSWGEEWFFRKTLGNQEITDWCLMRDEFGEYCLGFIVNGDIKNPQSVTAKNIFLCFGPGKFNKKSIVIQALRKVVEPQIEAYKKNMPMNCAYCRCNLFENKYEIDHKIDFKIIKDEYLTKRSIDELYEHREKEAVFYYVLKEPIKSEWYNFHEKRAILQPLCKSCHDKKTYGKREHSS